MTGIKVSCEHNNMSNILEGIKKTYIINKKVTAIISRKYICFDLLIEVNKGMNLNLSCVLMNL